MQMMPHAGRRKQRPTSTHRRCEERLSVQGCFYWEWRKGCKTSQQTVGNKFHWKEETEAALQLLARRHQHESWRVQVPEQTLKKSIHINCDECNESAVISEMFLLPVSSQVWNGLCFKWGDFAFLSCCSSVCLPQQKCTKGLIYKHSEFFVLKDLRTFFHIN